MRLGFALALMALATSFPVSAETLTNKSIIALVSAGLDSDTIIAKINSSDTKFDLSTEQLVALKKQGVPSPVITAMIAADGHGKGERVPLPRERVAGPDRAPGPERVVGPALGVPRPAGIYLLQSGQLVRIDPNVSGQTKTGGFLGSALSYGIAKISTRVVLQGDNARVRTNDRLPTFYFYLPASVSRSTASSFDAEASTEPASPNEFALVHLEMKKGSREARIGRANIAGSQSGVVDKDRINFSFDEARPGIFTVRPGATLAPGEYCFVRIGLGNASVSRFFDFSVQ